MRSRALGTGICALLAVLCLSACTGSSVSGVRAVPLDQGLALTQGSAATYTIVPGDDLTVRFYFNPQLDEDVRVRPDGKISLSLIGEIPAAGLSPEQLSGTITDKYAAQLKKPTAVVLVRGFANARAFIEGEVTVPGVLDMQQGQRTALQAIAASGGVTPNASLGSVILVRRVPGHDDPVVMELNLRGALSGTDPKQDVALMSGDLLYVPRSGAAEVNLALKMYFWDNLNASTFFGANKAVP